MDNKSPGKDVSELDIEDNLRLTTNSPSKPRIVKVKNVSIGSNHFVTMAGPNLVEDEEMIHTVAKVIASLGANILRGGAFKPLTFPKRSLRYRETRIQGLRWLRDASSENGLPCVSEITSFQDFEEAVSLVDMIQIGARNMQNFELLKVCASTMKPILLKRGFGNSLRDLLGAGEYILAEGNESLVFCERGIVSPHTHRSTSRFLLDIQIIPAFKELSGFPIIVDPSHASFWAPWVTDLALASVAAGADGVMIEVHPDPKNAAVDPLQPLNFTEFADCQEKVVQLSEMIRGFKRVKNTS